ncbi:MAG: sialidase family protein [Chthoniobacterales bacterium]
MKLWLVFLLAGAAVVCAQSAPRLPLADRSKLPPNLRNLPLEHLSSGGLMLLNQDDNLVTPPATAVSGKGGTAALEAATAPVALDPRIGPNIRLGNDPPQLPANMRAQAEPFIARALSIPDFLVAIFQEGRFAQDGGAVDCGYSVTHDGGLTWTRALIPALTRASGGPYYRATDPVVAFDINNSVYLNTLGATDATFANGAVLVSKSTDGGSTFTSPRVVYRPASNSVFPDKEWIAINAFPATPTAGRVLVTFTLFNNNSTEGAPIMRSYSDDGGSTWSPIASVNGSANSQGSQPLYLRNGNCAIVYWNFGSSSSPGEQLEVVSSTDGGVSFGPPHRIAAATEWNEPSIRSGTFLPSATTDRSTSSIYVVYQARLAGNPRIAFTKSADGGLTWTTPIAISDNPAGLGVFNPAISASPDGRTLSVAFYDHRNNPSSSTLVDLYLAQSFDGGATWQPNIRLSSVSSNAALAPLTSEGYMLGDYLGIANSPYSTVPAVPVWVDTRTGNPDPFVTRAGIAPYPDLATGWEAARLSLAQIPATSFRPSNDFDRDGEDTQSETATHTNPNNPLSVIRTGKQVDIATRLHVGTGDDAGIVGFIIQGSAPKRVLIRALGPELSQFGVAGVLNDPTLQLYHGGTAFAFNDNWQDSQAAEIQASGRAPSDAREPAIIQTLAPASYTAIVRGVNNSMGIALLELYDLDSGSSTIIRNMSTRGQVQTGDNVMIAGLIIGAGSGQNGDGSSEVLLRVLGPELSSFGLSNVLQDPTLDLYDGNGNVIFSNDNWQGTQRAPIQATGLAPGDPREPAILTTLVQGNWTGIVRGKNNTTGLALVEVYRVH